jgi:hypothetical protein
MNVLRTDGPSGAERTQAGKKRRIQTNRKKPAKMRGISVQIGRIATRKQNGTREAPLHAACRSGDGDARCGSQQAATDREGSAARRAAAA